MKVAVVTTDNRQHYQTYGATTPTFGAAPEALLQGFALLPELEVHVVLHDEADEVAGETGGEHLVSQRVCAEDWVDADFV